MDIDYVNSNLHYDGTELDYLEPLLYDKYNWDVICEQYYNIFIS